MNNGLENDSRIVYQGDENSHSAPRQTTCYVFTVESEYGRPLDELKPPEGYEFTGHFRPSEAGESWMGPSEAGESWMGFRFAGVKVDGATEVPVLILRPRPKRKRIIFEETLEREINSLYSRREEEF